MGLESADKVWKKDETAALIALYESEKSLYDKNDKLYSDTQKRKEGFERIRQVMQRIRPGCTVADIKSRIKYLRTQYASELLRKNISIDSNICTKDSYKPVLWCFGLLQFLDDFITAKKYSSKDTSEEEKSDEPEVDAKSQTIRASVAKNISTKSSKECGSETTRKKKELLNGDVNEEIRKQKKRKVSSTSSLSESAEKHTSRISTPEISAVEQMPAIPTIEQMPATPTVEQMPVTPTVEQMPVIKDYDREDIFGHYIASEMRALRDNPVLYLQTKQSILEILTSANFELINPE